MQLWHGAISAAFSALLLSSAASAETWTAAGLPTSGDVTITAGQVITLDQNLTLNSLTITGELSCANQNLALTAKWIMVHGRFACGTAASRFTNDLTITLTGTDQAESMMQMGTKFLGAMGGGQIELHGENRQGWTRLAASAAKGSNTITLVENPWRVGDKIVLVSTDFHWDHGEERTIQAMTGTTLTLDAPLAYRHHCATENFGATSITECGEVGLVTRNIVIRGDAASQASGFGGHVMVMANSSARIDGVEFLRMGQKGRVGRYPFHWHLIGDGTGQYIDNSSIIHSYNRFLSIHGTHNTHVGGNFAFDTTGHGYYIEDGIETGNVIEDNLGAHVKNATNETPTPSDNDASVFWISNPDNTVRRNVSAGSEHTGFWLGFPDHPIGLSTAAGVNVFPRNTPLKEFADNTSHSNSAHGIYVDGAEDASRHTQVTWFEPRQVPSDPQSANVPPVFLNFTAYKNRFEGIWMRGFSMPVFQGARIADNSMGAYFASISGTPGYIQDSLVVGETGNKGNPEDWEPKGAGGRELPLPWERHRSVRGIEFYDGPMVVRRTKFANFTSNDLRKSGALTSLSPNPHWISSLNAAESLNFSNANRVWIAPLKARNDGDSFSVFRDTDGSITGTAGRMIVPPNPVLLTGNCTRQKKWNAYVCPNSYVNVMIDAASGNSLIGTRLVRNDGKSRSIGSPVSSKTNLHINILENRPHQLVFPAGVPKRLEFIRNERAGKAARLSLTYPTSNFTFCLWGSQDVERAANLAALNNGGTKYYYDATTKRLHLRLVTPDGNWTGYVLKRP